MNRVDRVALFTILRKEVQRFLRIWVQTLVPPAITMTLYFVIFGNLIGPRIGPMDGYSYMQFIVPGIVMMAVITSSYSNVVSSFFGAKFQGCIEEMLVAPVGDHVILLGYIGGGVARGLCVGVLVSIVALCFTRMPVAHPVLLVAVAVLTAVLFSLAGFINAIYARNFDDISIIPNFVLTPLTYLGGVFYSIDLLPAFWRGASRANPVLYMVNGFRHGFLGTSDVDPATALTLIAAAIALLAAWALWLMRRGVGLRE